MDSLSFFIDYHLLFVTRLFLLFFLVIFLKIANVEYKIPGKFHCYIFFKNEREKNIKHT